MIITKNLVITNGRIIDPSVNLDTKTDILVQDGKIAEIAPSISVKENTEIIDATGCWVTPGLIDMHVHLRDPGQRHKETIVTGTRAAAAGGFTTICCMPNTSPVMDNEVVVEYVTSKAAKEAIVNVLPIGSITKGLAGEELSAIGEMKDAGICAVSDDGKTVENPSLYKTAMKYAAMFGLPILAHCEDLRLVGKGQINAGPHAELMGFRGIAPEAEEIIIARDIILARVTGAQLHICHVSTAEGVALIRVAQEAGLPVTAEVCPHHFTLIDENITEYDANFKMSPPLRSRKDRDALLQGLQDGTIGVIATDHAPHHEDEKNCEFEDAMNGIVGLETAVPLGITELVLKGKLTPSRLIAALSTNPAKILKLNKGTLQPGADADITIINPDDTYVIDKNKFHSKSRNTPFHGLEVTGRVTHTIVGGKVVYELRKSLNYIHMDKIKT
ncbi:MAG: dihydroorotase [Firmicutes bacterium]|nr:dihydroorotase [Bacillota bacterium]